MVELKLRCPEEVVYLGSFQEKTYGIYKADRLHIAVFGKSGTGKSTLLKFLIKQHIDLGEGFSLLDPHGDLALEIVKLIPKDRVDRLVYIDPTTVKVFGKTVRINFLEYRDDWDRERVGEAFISALQKLFKDFWGPRLEHILRNCVNTLLEQPPGSTSLLDLYYLLVDEDRRKELVANVEDPLVAKFWEEEWPRLPKDAIISVVNKISKLVGSRILRPIFSARRSTIDFRKLMDSRAFIIINLSKGRLTEEVSHFLGTLIIGKIFSAAMSRIDVAPRMRIPHYLYIDEAHNFTVPTLIDILAEARKYKLYLTLATQYPEQYPREILDAIMGNCRTFITFRVGLKSAKLLAKLYEPIFSEKDLINLPLYWFAVKTEVHGKPVRPFTLKTVYIPVDVQGSRFEDDPEISRRITKSLELYGAPIEEKAEAKLTGEAEENKEPGTIQVKEPPVRPIEAYVLYVLYYEGDMPTKVLEKRVAGFFGVSGSSVYGVFRGLAELGLVEVYEAGTRGRGRRPRLYKLTDKGRRLVEIVFSGERAGGPEHQEAIRRIVEELRLNLGVWTWIDTGEEPLREIPDVIAIPYRDANSWDTGNVLFIEVETRPSRDPGKIRKYIERAGKSGARILFVVGEKYLDYIRGFGAEASIPDNVVDAVKRILGW